ncbi:lycopene cyclase [Cokeromyces recurvatus]|uniref:lycopene cyclase n=1 Tax=Cokeromyces recurvatus TaxID=90255 RepID=UPI00221E6DFE|nr:lycopene cyclase [Cokeromyces recurvatus]KAI7899017.1 lycopene cyclase [Cokeromyces recurvatus]
MLTYMEVHLYYTLPVLGLLYCLLKPFHTNKDSIKYKFLVGIAFSTASIWDNYIVYHRAWSYCSTCVTAVIGHVPLEEYMFFIIMTLMTVAFTNLVMRWQLPSFYIKPNTPLIQTLFVRFVPILALLTISYKAWNLAIPNKPLFYGSCILWYTCPVLAWLWYTGGEYMLRRPMAVLISIWVPTVYLCWVDQIAIHAGTWAISLRTSTGKFARPDLPVEEFAFFLLINTVLVFASCSLDRAFAILHLFKENKQHGQLTSYTFSDLMWASCIPDQLLHKATLQDLLTSWSILRKASKSFYTASVVFPSDVRQDLGILYGFCRATDDLCDNEDISVDKRKTQLELTYQFIGELFDQKLSSPHCIRWDLYYQALPIDCLAAFRSFTRLRHVLQVEAVRELLDGYQWDLERRTIQDEDDLKRYSACVASSVGEMCTRIILSHERRDGLTKPEVDWTIDKAREMGLVLQYTNIARDIVTDSQELGRCYLPKNWLQPQELDLISQGRAKELGDKRLSGLSLRLIKKADHLMSSAINGIAKLPSHSQGGVRAACNVYTAIGAVLKDHHQHRHYPTRAYVSKLNRARIALLSVYNLYSHGEKPATNSIIKGKIRSFMVE